MRHSGTSDAEQQTPLGKPKQRDSQPGEHNNMEEKIAELTGKLKTLNFILNKTEEIIQKQNREALDRQETSILTKSRAINNLKEEIEELEFANRQVQKSDRIDSDRSIRVGSTRINPDRLGSARITKNICKMRGKRKISPCSSKSRTQPDQIESTLSTAKSPFCFLVSVSLKFKLIRVDPG